MGTEVGAVDSQVVVDEEIEPVAEPVEEDECTVNSDCGDYKLCLEGVCGTINDVYDTHSTCDSMCNFNNVLVKTSDGDEFTLSRGQGSYTGAGSIEWKLLSSAEYCLGEGATPVAIELTMKNYGEVVQEEVIILNLGEESKVITHPQIERIQFTLVVESYDETCS